MIKMSMTGFNFVPFSMEWNSTEIYVMSSDKTVADPRGFRGLGIIHINIRIAHSIVYQVIQISPPPAHPPIHPPNKSQKNRSYG